MLVASAALASTAFAGTGYVVNSGYGTVTPFNTDTLTTGTPIKVGTNPNQVAVTPDGKAAYVTNTGSNSVTPIDLATGIPGTPIPVSAPPYAIAITPDGQTAYVVSEGTSPSFTGSATPINLTTQAAGTPITTAKATRRGIFNSVPDLIAAIDAYLAATNDDPKPFVWTATAEQILTKVRRGRVTLDAITN